MSDPNMKNHAAFRPSYFHLNGLLYTEGLVHDEDTTESACIAFSEILSDMPEPRIAPDGEGGVEITHDQETMIQFNISTEPEFLPAFIMELEDAMSELDRTQVLDNIFCSLSWYYTFRCVKKTMNVSSVFVTFFWTFSEER